MSLISDTECVSFLLPTETLLTTYSFLIHSVRLSYLRDVEDPYGARVISLDPSYQANPYILAASLADVERWPQLNMPESPNLSEDEQERPLGFPGARLKHTQTIMGGRTGGLGLRVNAKRLSTSKRMSGTPRQQDVKNFISENAPVQEALSTTIPIVKTLVEPPALASDKEGTPPEPMVQVQQATAPEEPPVAKVVQFIPKFRGAAEMEARRRVRMAARRGAGGAPLPPVQQNLSFDSSSEDEVEITVASEVSSDEDEPAIDTMDEGDEFDPYVDVVFHSQLSLNPLFLQSLCCNTYGYL